MIFNFSVCYILFVDPRNREITNKIKNKKKQILAIVAAPPAIPPNPKIPAIIEIIIKAIVHRSIIIVLIISDL